MKTCYIIYLSLSLSQILTIRNKRPQTVWERGGITYDNVDDDGDDDDDDDDKDDDDDEDEMRKMEWRRIRWRMLM